LITITKKNAMKSPILFFTILITILSSCKKDDVKNNSEECYSNTNAQTLVHDNINREYVLYIPNSYDETSAVPLLVNFHGFGGSAVSTPFFRQVKNR
jgi:polyhydroxybutyrate depolymerase